MLDDNFSVIHDTNGKSCDFCQEIRASTSYFSRLYSQYLNNRIIKETANFVIFPSIGQIVEGYVLIVSKQHFTSVSSLPVEQINELRFLVDSVGEAFKSIYHKAPIFFEHGVPGGSGQYGGCGIYHLHLHAVPVNSRINLLNSLTDEFAFKHLQTIDELCDFVKLNKPYLLYIDQNRNIVVAETQSIPSQYFRRILAKKLGCRIWDWKSYGIEPSLIETYSKLKPIF